jgi:formate dehydrogenase major subunit
VTAVQISPSNGPTAWQEQYEELSAKTRQIAPVIEAAE